MSIFVCNIKLGTFIENLFITMKYLFMLLIILSSSKSCNKNSKSTTKNTMIETDAPQQLHDIWALKTIGDKDVSEFKYPNGVPTIEIFLSKMQVNGFTGCNNYFGPIQFIDKKNIRLGNVAATKKYCNNVDEMPFLKLLGEVDSYKLKKGILELKKADNILLSFKKVD